MENYVRVNKKMETSKEKIWAIGDAIDKEIAEELGANSVIEAANELVIVEADEVLNERNIKVLPDIFSNSGGVIASYLEWVQNSQHYSWSLQKVNDEIGKRMADVFDKIIEKRKETMSSP